MVDHNLERCINTPNPPDAGRLEAGFFGARQPRESHHDAMHSSVLTDSSYMVNVVVDRCAASVPRSADLAAPDGSTDR